MRPSVESLFVFVLTALSALGCGMASTASEHAAKDGGTWDRDPVSTSPPKLHNFGVDMTQLVDESLLRPITVDLPISLFGSPDPEGSGVRPNMAFRVQPSTMVISPLAAEVERVLFQAGYGDWEVHLRSPAHPRWLTIVDHVVDLQVQAGEQLEAGSIIGGATPWGSGYALVELHVIREPATRTDDIVHVCPVALVDNEPDMQHLQERLNAWSWPISGCVCQVIAEVPGNDGDLFCDANP